MSNADLRVTLFTMALSAFADTLVAMETFEGDTVVRMSAFKFLEEQTALHGEFLPRSILESGFMFHGERVPLVSPSGIFKPQVLDRFPLTFTTVPPKLNEPAPYEDDIGDDGIIRYRYRGTNPGHPDNVRMADAATNKIPLIYLYGIKPGLYRPVWPVFIIGSDPASLTFTAQVGKQLAVGESPAVGAEIEFERKYITRLVQARLHQAGFRARVLAAYNNSCAICELKHPELLDAAHILPDKHPNGKPIIPNGISLCSLHHATYDQNIVGIRPDLVIEIREDILAEHDGPTLRYAIQALQGQQLHTPKDKALKPNTDFLEIRYEQFMKAG